MTGFELKFSLKIVEKFGNKDLVVGSVTDQEKDVSFLDETDEPAAQQRDSSRLKKDTSFS